jgi:pimeloyl-ACP methyl ester carboxylesterase
VKKHRVVIMLSVALHLLMGAPTTIAADREAFDVVPASDEAYALIFTYFDHQAGDARWAHSVGKQRFGEIEVEKVILTSATGRSIPVFLALPPTASPPYPCVLLLHGMTASKDNWFNWQWASRLTRSLLEHGIAVLAMDAPGHGERSWEIGYQLPDREVIGYGRAYLFRDFIVHGVRDSRQCIDYLTTRDEIDSLRVGVVGVSMGGWTSFPLSALDDRIKVLVTASAGPIGPDPEPTAAQHFAPHITSVPVLMLIGTHDEFYPLMSVKQMHSQLGSETKELIEYDSGHFLPEEWWEPASQWLVRYLHP